jgi:tRNA U34 5-carboxymethylaminomethyl modifying GTPase MnmE/TrmE
VEKNNVLVAGDNYKQPATSAVEGHAVAIELVAEDLRLATRYLGRITGSVDVEDLLDVIFSDFCIGK